MQQEDDRCVCFAGRAIEHLDAVGFGPADGWSRCIESGVVLTRHQVFCRCS
jgi:hypothetical protein